MVVHMRDLCMGWHRIMEKKYEVRYMSGGAGELLGEKLTYEEAQVLVRSFAEDMHEERAADLVIRSDHSWEVA